MRKLKVLLLLSCLAVAAAADPSALEARTMQIAGELRCVVCQNETLAASQAPLAQDLRALIRSQLEQGRSEAQIRDFLVARYGEFVRYRPALSLHTAPLWLGPFVLLAAVLLGLQRWLRRQPKPDRSAS